MKEHDIDGKVYFLKSDAEPKINEYKDDMLKYKDDKKTLKEQVKSLENKNEDLTIDLKTEKEKFDSVGGSEEDQKQAKIEVANLKGQLQKSQSENTKLTDSVKGMKSSLSQLTSSTLLRGELAKFIHPDHMAKAEKLANLDAKTSDDGVLTMGADGIDVGSYVTRFAEGLPEWALSKNAKQGSGMQNQPNGNGGGKSWKDMAPNEREDLARTNKPLYLKMQMESIGYKTSPATPRGKEQQQVDSSG